VFVREETRLDISFIAAREGLASLTRGRWLMSASDAAYGEGITGLTRVGPVGSVRGLSRLVQVRLQDLIVNRDSARLALRWEATGPGSSLFPALDADILLSADGEEATKLTLDGVYRPPLGSFGAGLDQAVLSRVATATVRDFVGRLAKAITGSTADLPSDIRTSGHDRAGRRPPTSQVP
jgi:hypothetical protein